VLEGRDAIRQWLAKHGFKRRNGDPLSWEQVLDMEHRVGERLHLQRPAIGRHNGLVWSTHLLLLRWAVVNWEKLTPPTHPGWVPAPRTQRKWRRRERLLAQRQHDETGE
jgi:hypothetical protein